LKSFALDEIDRICSFHARSDGALDFVTLLFKMFSICFCFVGSSLFHFMSKRNSSTAASVGGSGSWTLLEGWRVVLLLAVLLLEDGSMVLAFLALAFAVE
jgi:hypothetical protein